MNIQDIMRGLPFPVQGLLMQAYGMTGNQQPQQNAGGGRGFVNPPLVNPNAAPPQMPRVQPSRPVGVPKDEAGFEDVIARIMAGGSTDELQNAPAVEAPTPVQAAMQPDLPAPAAQETAAAAPQAPAAPEGLLSRFGFSDGNQAMGAIGAALAAAGSADPAKTALGIQAQRSEEAKIAEARRRANMPKVDPIAGTPFFQITQPDGTTSVSSNPALAEYYKSQSASKANAAIEKAVLDDRLARGRDSVKADIKASDAAEPQLKTIQDQMQAISTARETLPRMGAMDQVKGATGRVGSFVAAMADPQMNIDSQRRSAVRVLDWVRSSEPLKGALSNVEGLKLDMPLPEAFASKQEWEAYFDNTEKVLKAAQDYYQKQVNRGSSAVGPNPNAPASAAPAAGGVSRPASKADFDALPKGSRFVAPDGKEYIK